MRSILFVAVAASLLIAVASSASGRRQLELDAFRAEPADWVKVGRAEPSDLITLTVAVKQRNVDKLEELVMRVSDPRSTEYGKHWSMKAVNHLVKPHEQSVETVIDWLTSHGIPRNELKHSMFSDFVYATVPVSVAERLLHTTYALFRHSDTGTEALRVESPYSVPFHIAEHLDFVSPTVRFPSIRALATPSSTPNDLFVTPSFLRALYQVGDAKGANSTANVQAVASFLEQYWSPADLQSFFKLLQNTSVGATPSQQIGPNDPTNPGVEAELDVQYIMGVGTGVNTWVYYTPGRSPTNPDNEPFLAFLLNLTSSVAVPNTISISYGEDEKSVGYDYAVRINTEFAKLGAAGVSIMVASGDNGAGGNCTAAGRLSPDFPSGSPWVTAVGGVTGGTAGATPTGEVADMISGGGFSDYWPRPSWQDEAVTNYIKSASGLPPSANWNQSGRGYPDVAAQSENFLVVTFGIPMPVAGTSCASPTFTAVISLLNELRVKEGKPSLGFLNPFIYQTAPSLTNSFNDVTVGGNEGCGFGGGFPAAAGWDAATGWGSPNYKLLSQAVSKLP